VKSHRRKWDRGRVWKLEKCRGFLFTSKISGTDFWMEGVGILSKSMEEQQKEKKKR
jgi:hypothetical protein